MCDVEFIGNLPQNGHLSLTPLGVSYITQVHNEIRDERTRRLHARGCPPLLKRLPFETYTFAHRVPKGINKSRLWENEPEFLISENEHGLEAGLDDNFESCRQCGEIFAVNAWAIEWWDIPDSAGFCGGLICVKYGNWHYIYSQKRS